MHQRNFIDYQLFLKMISLEKHLPRAYSYWRYRPFFRMSVKYSSVIYSEASTRRSPIFGDLGEIPLVVPMYYLREFRTPTYQLINDFVRNHNIIFKRGQTRNKRKLQHKFYSTESFQSFLRI